MRPVCGLEHTVHSQPVLTLRGQAVEQEDDAWHANHSKHNVNSHNQFPFLQESVHPHPFLAFWGVGKNEEQ